MSSYLGKYVSRIKEAYDKGDMETARKEQESVLKITRIRDQYGKYISSLEVIFILKAHNQQFGKTTLTFSVLGFTGLSGPAATKAFLRVVGLDVGSPRLPLAPISEESVERLKKDLSAAGFGELVSQ